MNKIINRNINLDWYLIKTKPNNDLTASKHLASQNFMVFAPLIRKTSRVAQKFVTNTKPLFPSYLFIGTWSKAPPWKSINSTRGVSKAITFDGTYRPVSSKLIEGLKCRCDDNDVVKPNTNITPGNTVKIEQGPFSNFIGEVEKVDDNQRVWLMIKLLQQKTRAQVSLNYISQIS